MITRVLIIGGYGNFGGFIARSLAKEGNIQIIIAGRNEDKAREFALGLHASHEAEAAVVDINNGLAPALALLQPYVVIHTSGPYQGQTYHVAEACIEQGCHYIDLADAREFVAGITELNGLAEEKGVLICSGASSVPCLTSAVVDEYAPEFQRLEKIEYGIATAHLTNRGLATISAVLSYAGKPFKTLIDGEMKDVYGWLSLSFRDFWRLNNRAMGNCDIPDLEIFPKRYSDLKTLRFKAGLELKVLHLGLFGLSWLVRLRLFPNLRPLAKIFLRISLLFDGIGKDDSGFYMSLIGLDKDGSPKQVDFEMVATHGAGLYIPSMPAILMAKKFANGSILKRGATPCLDLITLDEYLEALGKFDIRWRTIRRENL